MATTRGAYAKSIEVKRGILEACVAGFGESGFHGISMAEVARRAGISHTGLVHHFPDKEAILAALLTMQDARAAQYLADHSARDGDDPVIVIRGLIDTIVDPAPGLVGLSIALSAEAASPGHPAHEHFRRRFHGVRSFLSRQYSTLAAEGRLAHDVRPETLAALTVAMVEGLQEQWLYDRNTIDVTAAIHTGLAAFVPELALSGVGDGGVPHARGGDPVRIEEPPAHT